MLNFDPTKDYKVKAGDTFWSIATAHSLTVDELKALNPGKDPDALIVCSLSLYVYLLYQIGWLFSLGKYSISKNDDTIDGLYQLILILDGFLL